MYITENTETLEFEDFLKLLHLSVIKFGCVFT